MIEGILGWLFLSAAIITTTFIYISLGTDWFDNWENKNADTNKCIYAIIAIMLVVVPSFIISTIPDVVTYDRYEIISLNDNIVNRGDFFIGSGTVDSVSRYYFYKKVGVGYMQKNIPAAYTLIVMDENDNPYVKVTIKNGITDGYELHVPNNTIVREFNLNGK